MKESFLFLADGFEEMEAICAIDILRRAEIPLKTVSITSSLQVVGAHGVAIKADVIFDNTLFSDPRWIILPGGMPGAQNLYEFTPLQGLLKNQAENNEGYIAAICASPAVILGQMGLLKGHKATCYPGFEGMLKGAEFIDVPVVRSGNFILGNGPANAMAWALSIVATEKGEQTAMSVANGMLLYPRSEEEIDYYFG